MFNKYRLVLLLLLLLPLLLLLWLRVTECPQVDLIANGNMPASISHCLFRNFPGNFSSTFSDAAQCSFRSWVNFCSSRTAVGITLLYSHLPLLWQHAITLSSGTGCSCPVPSWIDFTLFHSLLSQHSVGQWDPSKYPSPAWFCRLIL